jgi:MFS transporter, DHA3 family, macrolide efflux protein
MLPFGGNMEQLQTPKSMKTFFIIWIGQIISIMGSGLTSFALGVWIFQQTGQATPFALTVLFGSLPRILMAPLAGSLADRWNRRWLMILSDSGAALITLALVVLVSTGQLEVWHIYLGAFISSSFGAFQEPAYMSSITMLVPKRELGRANGMVQMAQAVEMLIPPLAAGLLFGLIGLRGIFLIDFVTFFFAVGSLLIVRIPQPKLPPEVGGKRPSVWRDAAFGWNYLRARPGLFWLLIFFGMANFLLNLSAVLTGPMVLSFATPEALGLAQMSMGAGMLVGGIFMSAWGGPQRRIRGIFAFILLAGVGLAFAGLRPLVFTIAAGLFLLTFSIPFASGMSQAIFQSKITPSAQGRVFAVRTILSRMMMPLAFLLAGPLADQIFQPLLASGGALAETAIAAVVGSGPGRGIGLIFVLSGLALLAATFAAYANPRIRMIEEELPDALPEGEPEPGLAPSPAD